MKTVMRDLVSFQGSVSRIRILVWGILLATIKYPLDYAVAVYGFDYPWSPLTYFSVRRGPLLHAADLPQLWLSLLAVAAPFLWAGVALTVKRLRDSGISPMWSLFFFAPYINYLFFLVLCTLPPKRSVRSPDTPSVSADVPGDEQEQGVEGREFGRLIPHNKIGAFCIAFFAAFSISVASIVLASTFGEQWGLSLFLVAPLSIGFVAQFIVGYHDLRSSRPRFGQIISIAVLTVLSLFWSGREGLPCLIMATPILLPVVLIGAFVAHCVIKLGQVRTTSLVFAIGVIPVSTLIDGDFATQPSPRAVRSVIEINASPDLVWKYIVNFPRIESPTELIFRMGIAHPQAATIDGEGPSALRRCIFDQGVFEEPIEVWKPGEELTFGVLSQPSRLDSYLNVKRGQFLLRSIGAATTVVEGTTWFDLNVHPASYWTLWSDNIVETIHQRVLRHVKALAERDAEKVARKP